MFKGPVHQAFFITSAAEKTKTQAENSRKKLNLKEALSSFYKKLKKKHNFTENFPKTKKFSLGTTFNAVIVNKYFQFHTIFSTNIVFFLKIHKDIKWKKLKT